jgi:hypothetical protein
MPSITLAPLALPEREEGEQIARVDLVFYGVDHSGASYEARVYINNPEADERTEQDAAEGYAGSFTVFGHGGCYGDEGHCLPDQRTIDVFDRRAPHPLTPYTKTVIATEAVKRAIADTSTTEITVTVVPVVPQLFEGVEVEDKPLAFSEVRLLTYAD